MVAAAQAPGKRQPVERLRWAVVDRELRAVPDDLGLAAGVRTQVDPEAPVAGQPQLAVRAGGERGRGAGRQRAGREEVVREVHARGDSLELRRAQCVEHGARQRLGRGLGIRAPQGRLGDPGGGRQHGNGGGDRVDPSSGDASQSSHARVRPWWSITGTSGVLRVGLERSLRAGRSIVKRAPSTSTRPA
jgi:hypothetical protein